MGKLKYIIILIIVFEGTVFKKIVYVRSTIGKFHMFSFLDRIYNLQKVMCMSTHYTYL